MSVEIFIGWRYLKAKQRQAFISLITFISLAGVALGVTALIVVIAVMTGFEQDLKKKILGVNSHIVILKLGQPMVEYQQLLPKVEAEPGVASTEPFIYSQVMVNAYGGVSGAVLRGIDPVLAAKTGHVPNIVKKGRLAALNDENPTIMVGAELARQLGVTVGDAVRVVSPMGDITPLGSRTPKVRTFTIGGIFESGMYEYDTTLIYISLRQAQDFLNLGDSITGIEVKVHDIYQAHRIREDIIAHLGTGYWAKDWMQMNRNLFSALKLEKTAMFIILALTVLVAAFNIVSTLIMIVMEKTRDIAILKSMGATKGMVMRIFIFQGVFIGILGTLVGLGGGIFLCEILARYKFIKLPSDVYYITTLPVRMEMFDVALITFSAVLISFLATIYPAWQASRLNPVQALRYE